MVDDGWGREWADREVEKGKGMVKRYQFLTIKFTEQAGNAAGFGDFATAAKYNNLAREARDSMQYWLGHMNAFMGISAQLGFAEIVEEELDEEGSCP